MGEQYPKMQCSIRIATLSRDHFCRDFAIFSHFCFMKSHTNSRSEKKNRNSNFSHFTPQSLFFAHAVHFETFGQFYTIGFQIIFASLFVSDTIAGSQSLRSVSLKRFIVEVMW